MEEEQNKTSSDAANNANKNEINLDKILLPKKEAPGTTSQSAQRINAGALLQQEQHAAEQKLEMTVGEPESPKTPSLQTPPKEEGGVKSLQTFQGDIEKVVQQKNVSVISMAAAEAERRAQQPLQGEAPATAMDLAQLKRIGMVAGGVVLLFSALALVVYIFLPAPQTTIPERPVAPFIAVDDTKSAVFTPSEFTRDVLMEELVAARDTLEISLGLVARLRMGIASTSGEVREITTQEFLTTLVPNAPDGFVRTLEPEFVLGLHSYDGNQPFLILHTDSYERAFAGLLSWELAMRNDLMPLFDRTPPVRAPLATTTDTVPAVLSTGFVDRIVENHDARVIQNEHNDILLLWTFLNRNTILISTNEATVRDVIRRLNEVPILPTS